MMSVFLRVVFLCFTISGVCFGCISKEEHINEPTRQPIALTVPTDEDDEIWWASRLYNQLFWNPSQTWHELSAVLLFAWFLFLISTPCVQIWLTLGTWKQRAPLLLLSRLTWRTLPLPVRPKSLLEFDNPCDSSNDVRSSHNTLIPGSTSVCVDIRVFGHKQESGNIKPGHCPV